MAMGTENESVIKEVSSLVFFSAKLDIKRNLNVTDHTSMLSEMISRIANIFSCFT